MRPYILCEGVDDPLKSSFLSLPLISRLSTHEIKYAGTLSMRGSVRRPAVDLLPARVFLSTLTNGVVAAASFLTTAVVLADQERSPEMGSQEYDGGGAFPHRLPPPTPCVHLEGGGSVWGGCSLNTTVVPVVAQLEDGVGGLARTAAIGV